MYPAIEKEGTEAAKAGKNIEDNPYRIPDVMDEEGVWVAKAMIWDMGWIMGQDDA